MIEVERVRKRKAKDRDGIYKRRGHWHFEYKDRQTGQWRSKTTGKTIYNDAKEFKRAFMESLKGQYNPSNDRLRFTEAADAYIEHRCVAASAGTVRLEKERLRALKRLLAQITIPDLKLKDIDIKLVRSYQQKRIAEGVGPRTVNMEGQLLRSILKHHEQWKLDGRYEPLPEPVSEVGRSLTPEEEVRLPNEVLANPQGRTFKTYTTGAISQLKQQRQRRHQTSVLAPRVDRRARPEPHATRNQANAYGNVRHLFECIRTEMRKGSPEGYNAENGYS